MHVYLVRHAEAIDETLTLRDPHRHLTSHGRVQARALGDRLRWHDCHPTHIWSSPLVRAVQTAELLATGLDAPTLIEVAPELAPDGDVTKLVAAVRALPPTSSVMLVGHEPSLSAIGAAIVGDLGFAALAKAQAARIIDDVLRWRFVWDGDAPELVK